MAKKDLGVSPDYVERAFKKTPGESPADSVFYESKLHFLSMKEQMADLAFIQQNRPLKPPGQEGWKCPMPPSLVAKLAHRAAHEEWRKSR